MNYPTQNKHAEPRSGTSRLNWGDAFVGFGLIVAIWLYVWKAAPWWQVGVMFAIAAGQGVIIWRRWHRRHATQPSGELTVPTDINPGITDAELSRMYRHAYDGGQTDHHDVVNLIRQLVYRPTPPDTERCRHCEHGRRVHVVARGGQRDRCEMAGCECRAYEATPPNNTPMYIDTDRGRVTVPTGADSVDVGRDGILDRIVERALVGDHAGVSEEAEALEDAAYERGKRERLDVLGLCDRWARELPGEPEYLRGILSTIENDLLVALRPKEPKP